MSWTDAIRHVAERLGLLEALTDQPLGGLVEEQHASIGSDHVDRRVQSARELPHQEQFDRPIGSFQAIQHKLADMSLALQRATAAVQYAAMTCDAAAGDRTLETKNILIATGSVPFIIPVPGKDLPGVLSYRDLDDVNAMMLAAQSRSKAVGWKSPRTSAPSGACSVWSMFSTGIVSSALYCAPQICKAHSSPENHTH